MHLTLAALSARLGHFFILVCFLNDDKIPPLSVYQTIPLKSEDQIILYFGGGYQQWAPAKQSWATSPAVILHLLWQRQQSHRVLYLRPSLRPHSIIECDLCSLVLSRKFWYPSRTLSTVPPHGIHHCADRLVLKLGDGLRLHYRYKGSVQSLIIIVIPALMLIFIHKAIVVDWFAQPPCCSSSSWLLFLIRD